MWKNLETKTKDHPETSKCHQTVVPCSHFFGSTSSTKTCSKNTKQLSDSPERKSWGSEFRPSGKGQWIQSRMVWDAGVGQIKFRDKIRNQKYWKTHGKKNLLCLSKGSKGAYYGNLPKFSLSYSILSLWVFPCLLHGTTKSSAMTVPNSCCGSECRGCSLNQASKNPSCNVLRA